MLTRANVTLRVLRALPELPHEVMALPASDGVLIVLKRQHGCSAAQQQVAPRGVGRFHLETPAPWLRGAARERSDAARP